jgi:Fe-S-cluster containining protein
MENDDHSLSLLNHCKTCTSSCCTKGKVITTEKNHEEILATGAEDNFWKIELPVGNFYILDFKMGSCRYLDDTGRCTIENVKPMVCKTYPVFPKGQDAYTLKTGCPAVSALRDTEAFSLYIAEARNLMAKEMAETPYDHFCDAFDAFDHKDYAPYLETHHAKITAPPSAQ